jgi:hypothetical protein
MGIDIVGDIIAILKTIAEVKYTQLDNVMFVHSGISYT